MGVFEGRMEVVNHLGEAARGMLVPILIKDVELDVPLLHWEVGHGRLLRAARARRGVYYQHWNSRRYAGYRGIPWDTVGYGRLREEGRRLGSIHVLMLGNEPNLALDGHRVSKSHYNIAIETKHGLYGSG